MSSPYTVGMREEVKDLVEEWKVPCDISRFISTKNAQGRLSGSFVNQISGESLWIQPIGGLSEVEVRGLDDETTHLAYQSWSGYAMQAKDRIFASGDTYAYDVVRVHIKESHRVSELKQVKRD